ncbi:MAG: NAD(P)H-dependent oxidoreductase [Planctomycetes bacterium]|nr:NAD(P)H-dependent oxidoreductase [Planctomycetota bacterium]
MKKIVVVPGTNRQGSLTGLLAKPVCADYRELGFEVDCLDLSTMTAQFLEPGAYKAPGTDVKAMVDRFLVADGVVFLVPEYNGSYPGVLKLYIDMLPYPEGFEARPCAFIGLAAGQFRALRAVEHLQAVVGYRNGHIFPRRVFIGDSYKQFDFEAQGALVDLELRERLTDQAKGFAAFIGAVRPS